VELEIIKYLEMLIPGGEALGIGDTRQDLLAYEANDRRGQLVDQHALRKFRVAPPDCQRPDSRIDKDSLFRLRPAM